MLYFLQLMCCYLHNILLTVSCGVRIATKNVIAIIPLFVMRLVLDVLCKTQKIEDFPLFGNSFFAYFC